MNKNIIKIIISYMVFLITIPVRIVPICKKRILFTGLTGGKNYDYSCNPKYLYEYLREQDTNKYNYVWLVSDKEKYAFLKSEDTKIAKHFSFLAFFYLLTSKVVVSNGSYIPWLVFRKKQYVINTWHGGGAYKKVENGKPDADWATKKRAELCAKNISLFVASCKEQEENMIRQTYIYNGEVLKEGTPRNDILVQGNTKEMRERVRSFYNIKDNEKIVMYAPTYRNMTEAVQLESDVLLQALNQNDQEGCTWRFFCKYHRYQNSDSNLHVVGKEVIDVADYPDMQELLCAADMLITDYSSCVWDYSFLCKPCFLFVPDREQYEEETGFYVGLDEWPYPKTYNMEELIKAIQCFDNKQLANNITEHKVQLGSYESGRCREVLSERISSICNS